MKKVILLALFMPAMAYGQIVENFESGNLTNWVQSPDGHWKSDTASAMSGGYSLHHIFDNSDAGTDKTGIPIMNLHPSLGNTRWTFLIRHGYDPSSSNNWFVFLMSDSDPSSASPVGNTNGFALGVNINGYDDTLRLVKVKANTLTTIVNCRINWQTQIGISDPVSVVAERSPEGIWSVSVNRANGNLIGTASGTDNELFSPSWFIICYRYSSSRDRLLWFDDLKIEGAFFVDNEPPVINDCIVTSKRSVDITFNEEPSADFQIPENISLNEEGIKPLTIVKISDLIYRVEFTNNLNNKSLNNLIINNLCDCSGNCTHNVSATFTPVWADVGDVIISEIMADPLPEVSLPGKDYLELMNRSEYSFNIRNWKLTDDGQSILLPDVVLGPSEVSILCLSKDTSVFKKFGKVIGLKQFPSLTDGGKLIYLSDSLGSLIHGVEYSSDWYADELKASGGWSLEMIDTRFPFFGEGNWKASVSHSGGSPGSVNSVSSYNPDTFFSGIENVFPDDSNGFTIRFSEPVIGFQEEVKNILIEGMETEKIYPEDPLSRKFFVKPSEPLIPGEVYTVEISESISDFAGNTIRNRKSVFGLPETATLGDILFNELLFNPLPGDPDYIELYNCSGKVIDASRLQLVAINDASGDTAQLIAVSDEKRCIMQGSYYAITADREKTSERYFSSDPEFLFETGSLPSMADDQGHLVLLNRELEKIDEVFYNEKMHYSLLSDFEGVALEKTGIRLDSKVSENWHSASEIAGWGTPGAPNSVYPELPVNADKVVLSSSRITPDNDGNEDYLAISLSLEGNGNVVSIRVYDETGNYVRKIAANMLTGPVATLIWDGTADDGTQVRTGIYIIFITIFDDKGKTEKWKEVCSVIRR
jgi:hypothetical protein